MIYGKGGPFGSKSKRRVIPGEHDKAFAALGKAVEERSDWLLFLKVDPCVDPLREDVRFGELLRRVRLPEGR